MEKAFLNQKNRTYTILILVTVTLLAFLIRAPGLGKWSLTLDEFYYSQPVSFILEKGVPELPGGGYYARGIGLQYLTAIPATIFEDWEFAVRSIPLIFGILTIPLFFLFCRFFLPVIPSLLCTTILLFSSWHIEFSRFARFYVPFQFVFLAFIYFFYSGYWLHRKNHRIVALAIALLSIFIYEGSIFLPLLLFSALLLEDSVLEKRNVKLILYASTLILLNMVFNAVNFLRLGVVNPLPAGMESAVRGESAISLPHFDLFQSLGGSPLLLVGYFLLCGGGAYLLFHMVRQRRDFWYVASMVPAIFFPLIHQYGLLVYLFGMLIAVKKDILQKCIDNIKIFTAYYLATLLFWTAVIFLSGNSNKILHYLVGFPPVKFTIILPFANVVPAWGVFLSLCIIISLLHNFVSRKTNSRDFLLTVILICLFIFPIIRTPYYKTRYIYFLFPLVIIPGFTGLQAFLHWIEESIRNNRVKSLARCLIIVPVLVFTVTEDFNLRHLYQASSKDINFRLGKYSGLEEHWYPRLDYESPARYVNSAYKEGDVIVLDHVIMSRYITGPYINYIDRSSVRFPYGARKEGREEMWTGRPLIYEKSELPEKVPLDPDYCLWLVAGGLENTTFGSSFDNENITKGKKINIYELFGKGGFDVSLQFRGVDGRIGVWQIRRAGNKKDNEKHAGTARKF